MATTKTLLLPEAGGPFQLAQTRKPSVGPNEIGVRLNAIALNPIDWIQRDYGYMVQDWPAHLGADGAGVVEDVGPDVTRFKVGDEVASLALPIKEGTNDRSFKEYIVVAANMAIHKPASWSSEEVASLPMAYHTAAAAIHSGLCLALPYIDGTEGEDLGIKSVLVLGGSSSVGSQAVQLMRMEHPDLVIFATSSPAHHERIVTLGATKMFNQRSATLIADVQKAAPGGKGVDAILDAVGAAAKDTSIFGALSASGTRRYSEVATGQEFEKPKDLDASLAYAASILSLPGGGNTMAGLDKIVNNGQYKLPIPLKHIGHGLEAINGGLDELKAGVSGTKLTLTL